MARLHREVDDQGLPAAEAVKCEDDLDGAKWRHRPSSPSPSSVSSSGTKGPPSGLPVAPGGASPTAVAAAGARGLRPVLAPAPVVSSPSSRACVPRKKLLFRQKDITSPPPPPQVPPAPLPPPPPPPPPPPYPMAPRPPCPRPPQVLHMVDPPLSKEDGWE